jgi:aspartyl aminopeptidase
MEKKHLADLYNSEQTHQAMLFAQGYKHFLNVAKTERLAVKEVLAMASKAGYVLATDHMTLHPGDKVMFVNRGKNVVLVHVGHQPLTAGFSMVAAHVDSPRLDLKPSPLYEDAQLALLRTHYYGGIKKYQWGSRPLALYGVVCCKDGKKIDIALGDGADDPVFTIPDLLPHLDRKVQRERKADEVLRGEDLKVVFASLPDMTVPADSKERIKKAVLSYLFTTYGIDEEDFMSADLEIVPAGEAKDVGIDRALVGGYGQDDRVCAYAACMAQLHLDHTPEQTAIVFLADKEEIGSVGSTGMKSNFWRYAIAQLLESSALPSDHATMLKTFWHSTCLSADVTAAFDPLFKEVHDEQNTARLHHGLAITKYTGSAGKAGASEADAELVAGIRSLFATHHVAYQVGQLGRVDEGGGGTVAAFIANHGVRTLDCGVAVLAMHSPFELASKLDLHEMYRGYHAFLLHGVRISD